MSLIDCPECGHEVSEKAQACPNCGVPQQAEDSPEQPRVPSAGWHRKLYELSGWKVAAAYLLLLAADVGAIALAVQGEAEGWNNTNWTKRAIMERYDL